MACCLTAPSHYLNQCWLIISKVQWHPSESNFTRESSSVPEIRLKIIYLKFCSNLPGTNDLMGCSHNMRVYMGVWVCAMCSLAPLQRVYVRVCEFALFVAIFGWSLKWLNATMSLNLAHCVASNYTSVHYAAFVKVFKAWVASDYVLSPWLAIVLHAMEALKFMSHQDASKVTCCAANITMEYIDRFYYEKRNPQITMKSMGYRPHDLSWI